jgi:SAM-dependent methyltransferase
VRNYRDHFAHVAPRYDALRDEAADEVLGWIAEASDFAAGHALIDIGCGTGATTAALARRFALEVVGVDPSSEMLAVAADRDCVECRFVRARAEQLPFRDDSFDRALMQTAVHLMDRLAAFAEVRRVLRPDGTLTILTVDPAGVDDFWLADWFPSYPSIDRARFPSGTTLRDELRRAGFAEVDVRHRARELHFTRERALAMLRSRFASSFAVMRDEEYDAGVERAQREMPEAFVATLRLVVLTARRQRE